MVDGKGDPQVRAQGRTKPDREWYPENFDWYVKWAATAAILTSVLFRNAGPDYREYDLAIGTIGTILWLWVSIMWRDRALILLNGAMTFLLGTAFIREFL